MVRYRGWIPNKTGKLSFSQLGKQNPDNIIYDRKFESPGGCEYLIAENRLFKLDDSAFGLYSKFGRAIFGMEDIVFVLSARCKKRAVSSDLLVGQVWCKYGRVNKRNFQKNIGLCDKVFSVNFLVNRNGACKIYKIEASEELIYDGTYLAFEEWMASQTYMFLKDILHRHKHHPKSSDTFLDIKTLGDGQEWARQTAYSLGNMAIKGPDPKNPETLQNTLGVIAYLESLMGSHKKKTKGIYKDRNLNAWKSSLTAESLNAHYYIGGRRWASGIAIGIYGFCSKILTWPDKVTGLSAANYWYLALYVALILYLFQFASIWPAIKTQIGTDAHKLSSKYPLLGAIFWIFAIIISAKYLVLPATMPV